MEYQPPERPSPTPGSSFPPYGQPNQPSGYNQPAGYTPPPMYTPPPVYGQPNVPSSYGPGTPYGYTYQDELRRAAIGRSYVTPAIITLVLYCVLWIPGLIANVVYLNSANKDKQLTGVEPEGRGCLLTMLIVIVAIPVALSLVGGGLLMIGLLASSASH